MTASDDSPEGERAAFHSMDDTVEVPRVRLTDQPSAAHPAEPPNTGARASSMRWRWLTPLVCVLCGAMFPISAANSGGSDLRPGRYTDLGALADAQRAEGERLTQKASLLNAEIAALSAEIKDARVRAARRKAEALESPAGLKEVRGTGVRITLSDAPADVRAVSTADPLWMIVHQQDIQAVVNALWKGGATAITLQGQRIVSTTGIRCEGSLVLLQGQPYAQPYVIEAVGNPYLLQSALDADALINYYRQQSADPEVQIGWQLDFVDEVVAPPFRGVLATRYARPIGGSAAY